jgi:hypothetical protein
MTPFLWLLAGLWLGMSVFTYGLVFAFFQRGWPDVAAHDYWRDCLVAMICGMCWTGGLTGYLFRRLVLSRLVSGPASWVPSQHQPYGLKFWLVLGGLLSMTIPFSA